MTQAAVEGGDEAALAAFAAGTTDLPLVPPSTGARSGLKPPLGNGNHRASSASATGRVDGLGSWAAAASVTATDAVHVSTTAVPCVSIGAVHTLFCMSRQHISWLSPAEGIGSIDHPCVAAATVEKAGLGHRRGQCPRHRWRLAKLPTADENLPRPRLSGNRRRVRRRLRSRAGDSGPCRSHHRQQSRS